ncbi:SWIM zinc finger family protein [Cognatiyoonia sp. IB215446]|uniref:SWIM zinc finger family protein n=1 Tax=Cognatiyoonia sp. IB215446 TaxID=3097355 RepID=UPI002A0DC063|nr:SWIM zinc finger family protein [Cognatiyoonia sp. IB215446]MDX8350243.1 SWIM zinc finger family protein [Cognatiyoonia sp. IB215446]
MTLAALLDTHDESALAALASVGLVRRASRDLEAGNFQITSRDDTQAKVTTGDQTVELKGPSLTDATCTCPATGICRHVVLAVLALRANESLATAPDDVPKRTAHDDLTNLTEAALRKFAGVDWDKALTQATISVEGTVVEDGTNLSVQLPDTEMPVTFLAGLGLKGAVFKGPKSTKRRVVTAAALLVRTQSGTQKLDDLAPASAEAGPLSVDFLQDARAAVETLVSGVFGGGSSVAEEAMFDIAISARSQAAPRLTGLMRTLARQARQARDHHVRYDDVTFLTLSATTCALIHALEATPLDSELTGVVRRSYSDLPETHLLPLAAVKWQSATGARGMRLHIFVPEEGQWYSSGQARGAGMDPTFSPSAAYQAPLWIAGTTKSLIGKHVTLRNGRTSPDRFLPMDHGQAEIITGAGNAAETLAQCGALFANFAAARADLTARLPTGLRQAGRAVPIALRPTSYGEASFDDIAQLYRLPIVGTDGSTLELTLTSGDDVKWLTVQASRVECFVCEATFTNRQLTLAPVTAYLPRTNDKPQNICNLTLDSERQRANAMAISGRAWSLLKNTITGAPTMARDPIEDLSIQVLEGIAEMLRFHDPSVLAKISRKSETLGLTGLASAIEKTVETGSVADSLRASYIAAEVSHLATVTA